MKGREDKGKECHRSERIIQDLNEIFHHLITEERETEKAGLYELELKLGSGAWI